MHKKGFSGKLFQNSKMRQCHLSRINILAEYFLTWGAGLGKPKKSQNNPKKGTKIPELIKKGSQNDPVLGFRSECLGFRV